MTLIQCDLRPVNADELLASCRKVISDFTVTAFSRERDLINALNIISVCWPIITDKNLQKLNLTAKLKTSLTKKLPCGFASLSEYLRPGDFRLVSLRIRGRVLCGPWIGFHIWSPERWDFCSIFLSWLKNFAKKYWTWIYSTRKSDDGRFFGLRLIIESNLHKEGPHDLKENFRSPCSKNFKSPRLRFSK